MTSPPVHRLRLGLLFLAGCLLSGALGAVMTRRLGQEQPPRAETPAPQDLRAEIRRRIAANVEPLRTEAELEHYLSELEAAARARGFATALEVEPGLAAIEKVLGGHGPGAVVRRQGAFDASMRAVPGATPATR
ncbi:hypothetical protein NR798_15410 [Archangium gephyra]|uniref:hypothetical protein n=1 Tax=Archangium gephyra TaxID=48 RepID=UPI0035D4F248